MKLLSNSKYAILLILLLASFLRVWKLDIVPPSLFGDELDVGYHAYSILKTGQDYSGNFMPMHFQSLAEWRTPLYLYSSVPTVAIFGISAWGVRLPAAIFGILGVWLFYLLVVEITKQKALALLASFLLAISPWHIQYSRAGFEVTQLLSFYIAGLYFFIKGLRNNKYMVFSAAFFGLTPWVYSTAKLLLPLTVLGMGVIWWKDIFKVQKKYLTWSLVVFFVLTTPIAYSTLFGGGADRFNYISVFSDPTMSPEIGFARLSDAKVRDLQATIGIHPSVLDRAFHNKITWLSTFIGKNYLKSFSTEFLFTQGDPNPRHSPTGIGEFYKFEALFVLLGFAFLLFAKIDKKTKYFIFFWILVAPLPAALTRDGGNHATRLFLFLPPLLFLVSYGVYQSYKTLQGSIRPFFVFAYSFLLLVSFIFYQHLYWVHYSWDSERWWHAGFEDAIKTAVSQSGNYDKVVISMAGEPAMIFFLGWSEYSPQEFHSEYIKRGEGGLDLPRVELGQFGRVSKLGKYYFGSPGVDLYSLAQALPDKTLYVATAKEVSVNLIQGPERLPKDLKMIKAVAYPSGEPAFFLLTKSQ